MREPTMSLLMLRAIGMKSGLLSNVCRISPISSHNWIYFSSSSETDKTKYYETNEADGPNDFGYVRPDARFKNDRPTILYAKAMPLSVSAMRHEQILQLAEEGSIGARREALIRHIMGVDSIEYEKALIVMKKISKENRKGMNLYYSPYQIGLFTALVGGTASFPLVFQRDIVKWFNNVYVTADIPSKDDLETWLEVGSWSWNWMEPVLGQISFALLVMAYIRNQMLSLGYRPYRNFINQRQAANLVKAFPRLNPHLLQQYSNSTSYAMRDENH